MLSIAFALRYRQTFSIGLGMAAELATAGTRSKGVRADIRFTETHGAEGKDVDDVRGELARIPLCDDRCSMACGEADVCSLLF
jgi:hypothetical protein